jgi:2-dehydro-3-deoxyphosphogluconate aldolase/(4S)-4-hydroxy-2-oxoglutarate aldolase
MEEEKHVVPVAKALYEGGVQAIEVTMGTPGALRVIETIATQHPHILIGVGSVLDAQTARAALLAGATFIVTPVSKQEVTEMAHRYDAPIFSGAFSPTEILTAFEQGADVIKVFPAEILGIPYFKAIKAPMPQLQLMPTGGVTVDNVGDWLKAGACAVGVGSALLNKKAIAEQNYQVITDLASQFTRNIAKARQ